MHMMGGAGAVAIIILIAGALLGWTVMLERVLWLVGSIFVGAVVGLGAALASGWREQHDRLSQTSLSNPMKTPVMSCPHCGSTVNSALALCPRCHHDLKRNCPNCGAIIDAQAKRCPSCSTLLPEQRAEAERATTV